MNKRWLVPVTCLLLGLGCSTPTHKPELNWSRVEITLEGSGYYQGSLEWRPYYEAMLELGISPRKACANVLLCAKHASKRSMGKLMRKHETKAAFQEALDLEIAEGADARYATPTDHTYEHTPLYTSSREGSWNRLVEQVEQGPIYSNSFMWRSLYDRMIDMGMDPDRVRRNIVRIARFGPSRSVVEKVFEKNPGPEKLQAALDLSHSDALDRLWEFEDEGVFWGYPHPARGANEPDEIRKLQRNTLIQGERAQESLAKPLTSTDEPPVASEEIDESEIDESEVDESEVDESEVDESEIDEADLMDDELDLDEDIDLDEDPDLDAEIDALEEEFDDEADEFDDADEMTDGEADLPPVEDDGEADLPPVEDDDEADLPPVEDDGEADLPPVEDEGTRGSEPDGK